MPSPSDPASMWAQYGVLGLLVVAFMVGWIVPGPMVKQKDEEIRRLQRLVEEEILPMAKHYAETLAQVTPVLDKAIQALRDHHRDGS